MMHRTHLFLYFCPTQLGRANQSQSVCKIRGVYRASVTKHRNVTFTYSHTHAIYLCMCILSASSQVIMQMRWERPILNSAAATWRLWNCTRSCYPGTRGSSASYGWAPQDTVYYPHLNSSIRCVQHIRSWESPTLHQENEEQGKMESMQWGQSWGTGTVYTIPDLDNYCLVLLRSWGRVTHGVGVTHGTWSWSGGQIYFSELLLLFHVWLMCTL